MKGRISRELLPKPPVRNYFPLKTTNLGTSGSRPFSDHEERTTNGRGGGLFGGRRGGRLVGPLRSLMTQGLGVPPVFSLVRRCRTFWDKRKKFDVSKLNVFITYEQRCLPYYVFLDTVLLIKRRGV